MKTSTTISKIAPALLAAQKAMGNATKDAKNPFFKSTYADLNSVREAVTNALHANGVTILQPTGHVFGTGVTIPVVHTTLLHESGEYISSDTEIVVKEANNPQQYGSAVSYARRYGLSSLLSVGTVDDDGELAMARNTPTKIKPATATASDTSSAIPTNGTAKLGSFRKPATTNG